MALSKAEAAAKSSELIKGDVEALEAKIDRWLADHGDHRRLYDVRGVSPGVRAEIERRYRAAGWTVTYHSDQRDGDFWEFA